ncbi:MAG: hypothetical protein II851_03865 [Bacteroidales bacterium]|nr:hypothetical protein [Bacteroidales bacterium]
MRKQPYLPLYESPRVEILEFLSQGVLCQSGETDDLVRDDDVDWFNG